MNVERVGPHTQRVAKRLREVRRTQGRSLEDVADRSGHTVNILSRIERGERAITVEDLFSLAEALGTPVEAIVKPVPVWVLS